jgi:hypothetical protein
LLEKDKIRVIRVRSHKFVTDVVDDKTVDSEHDPNQVLPFAFFSKVLYKRLVVCSSRSNAIRFLGHFADHPGAVSADGCLECVAAAFHFERFHFHHDQDAFDGFFSSPHYWYRFASHRECVVDDNLYRVSNWGDVFDFSGPTDQLVQFPRLFLAFPVAVAYLARIRTFNQ